MKKYFAAALVSMALPLFACAQSAVCYGLNCPGQSSGDISTAMESFNSMIQFQTESANIIADSLEIPPESRRTCLQRCQRQLNHDRDACEKDFLEGFSLSGSDKAGYIMCMNAASSAYAQCYDPMTFLNCPPL